MPLAKPCAQGPLSAHSAHGLVSSRRRCEGQQRFAAITGITTPEPITLFIAVVTVAAAWDRARTVANRTVSPITRRINTRTHRYFRAIRHLPNLMPLLVDIATPTKFCPKQLLRRLFTGRSLLIRLSSASRPRDAPRDVYRLTQIVYII